MSTCLAEGCKNNVFSHLYCKFHQYMRRMWGGDLYNAKSSQKRTNKPPLRESGYKIPRRSKKRDTQEKYYVEQAKEFFQDAVNNGTNICIFCGQKVTKFQGLHHWKGRVGKYLLDKLWWSVVHNDCHLFYHRSTIAQLKSEFGDAFFERLKLFSTDLWEVIINRENKTHKLNPSLFEDSDEDLL